MKDELFVRLRRIRNGASLYSICGIHFYTGRWVRVPEVVQLEKDKTLDLGDYLRGLKTEDGNQPRFDVTDEAGAQAIEQRELEEEERMLAASRASTGYKSLVSRAVVPAGAVPAPTDTGTERFTDDELAEAMEIVRLRREAAKAEQEGQQDGDDAGGKPEAETSVEADNTSTSRRAQRKARMEKASGKDSPAT